MEGIEGGISGEAYCEQLAQICMHNVISGGAAGGAQYGFGRANCGYYGWGETYIGGRYIMLQA